MSDDVLILTAADVRAQLAGKEAAVIEAVRRAYVAHAEGRSALPHSTFLQFPNEPRNRIIALPAYLDDGERWAGVKWISSFPNNVARGLARASAVIVLNSMTDGRAAAILEGSEISAARTAASAALAALALRDAAAPHTLSMLGCGEINRAVLRYLTFLLGPFETVSLFDLDNARAEAFGEICRREYHCRVELVDDWRAALAASPLSSIATTASSPYIDHLSACPAGGVILHLSLRDLAPEVILDADNIVDDADHVCRTQTSLHRAESLVGHRRFIRAPLADLLRGAAPSRTGPIAVFSPFGLGVLDLAVAALVVTGARARGNGTFVPFSSPAGSIAATAANAESTRP